MSEVEVRPFRRADREQLTALVNAHVQAVVPGLSVSVNTVLSRRRATGRTQWPRPVGPPIPGLALGRAVGINGTRLYGSLGDQLIGYIEVETNLAEGGRLAHLGGWADVGNLHVKEAYRRQGVTTWLVGQAAGWLRLARVDRLLDYAWPEEEGRLALLGKVGCRELTRTDRGWVHRPGPAAL